MDCPKCIGKLQARVITFRAHSSVEPLSGAGIQYDLELDQCFVCGGVWCDKGELDKYLRDDIEIIDSPSLGHETDKAFDAKQGPCPRCTVPLKHIPGPNSEAMTVGQCPKCEGVWLDSTEIDRLKRIHKTKAGVLKQLLAVFRKKSSPSAG